MAFAKAFAFFAVLALASAAFAQADPCVAAKAECRDVICAGHQVVKNECEFWGNGMSKACVCGDEAAILGSKDEVKASDNDKEGMDCDDTAELGENEEVDQKVVAMPMRMAFAFGRRFGPQGGVVQVSRPLGLSGLFDDGDSDDSMSSLGMLFNVLRARQALLQASPSYVARRVYYPGNGVAFQIATASDDEEGRQRLVDVAAQRHVAEEEARQHHHQHHDHGHDHGMERLAPRESLHLDAAPAPAKVDLAVPAPAEWDDEEAAPKAWYNGYHARRALYCVASILLILGVIFLNAALLMCCIGGQRAEDEPEIELDIVAASTPLLVEYDVHKSNPPKVADGKQMVIVHELVSLPREGRCAY